MSDFTEIFKTRDQYGLISVLEDKETRVLSFGENDEQSKLLKLSPHIPQHTYLRAMLLVLLFCQPKRAIILGLGGGGLVHALRHYDAAMKVTAVELSEQVIAVAKKYFQLPMSKKLTLVNQDAGHFLAEKNHKKVDVIFADIYDVVGVDKKQLSAEFIVQCTHLIKADGYLVLNCWKEQKFDQDLLDLLQSNFSDVRACLTGAGNWVIIAGKVSREISHSALKLKAQQLSQQLDFPLAKSLARFEPWLHG